MYMHSSEQVVIKNGVTLLYCKIRNGIYGLKTQKLGTNAAHNASTNSWNKDILEFKVKSRGPSKRVKREPH